MQLTSLTPQRTSQPRAFTLETPGSEPYVPRWNGRGTDGVDLNALYRDEHEWKPADLHLLFPTSCPEGNAYYAMDSNLEHGWPGSVTAHESGHGDLAGWAAGHGIVDAALDGMSYEQAQEWRIAR